MKKLMMTVAIVCAAVCAQASAVNWNTAVNYWNGAGGSASSSSGTKLGKDAMTAYLFILADQSAYNSALASISGQDGAAAKYAEDKVKAGGWDATKNTAKAGSISLTDGVDYSEGAKVYALIIGKTTQSETDYYYANVAQYEVGATDGVVQNLNVNLGGSSSASTTAIKWNAAAVPEPTSGLLMLLGVAGLALRRRRA